MIIGAVVLLALLCASSTTALRPNTTLTPCIGHEGTVEDSESFILAVWRLERWKRGDPSPRTIRAFRLKVLCAVGPGHRKALRKRWRSSQRIYFERRHRKRAELAYLAAITPPGPAVLAAIRSCESGGDYSINTGNGFSGAYQFLQSTWEAVGGTGFPHEASPREQDERAARLYRESGSSPWPVCGV